MKLSKTLAVALHRAMWTDMQTELGDNPTPNQRACFKATWINKYFPNENVVHNCFLCEYAFTGDNHSCSACPIRWPKGHCTGYNFSYCTAPISDILALPEKGECRANMPDDCKKYVAYDETAAVRAYYTYREEQLSKASGVPGFESIEDHVKAIQEKAVEEYFEKTPGAKLASMDVDQAFKQYADEQKAPIFHALAEASGLSDGNEAVKAHIYEISRKAKNSGRREQAEDIYTALSLYSGVSADNWTVYDHVRAIQMKAQEQVKTEEPYRKASTLLLDTLNKYKDYLSDESGLDRNRPVGDHIKEIYDAFSDGRLYERERIMDKIGEMLNDQSTGETKNS